MSEFPPSGSGAAAPAVSTNGPDHAAPGTAALQARAALHRPHVLVVDDDRGHRVLLARLLDQNGFRASLAGDGAAALKLVGTAQPDLVLLDVMLPGEDGLAFMRRLRAVSALPVIMLTALGQGAHRVAGLDSGADDYVAKPFDPDELLARIRAVLRRSRDRAAEAALTSRSGALLPRGPRRYRFAGWTLDAARREVWSPEGVLISMTSGEFDLLLAFCDHPQMMLTREHLVELTTGKPSDGEDRRIDILVSRIRRKLEPQIGAALDGSENPGRRSRILKTVRNGGYQFAVPVTIEPQA
jgi:two-component system OmpR family response regulator